MNTLNKQGKENKADQHPEALCSHTIGILLRNVYKGSESSVTQVIHNARLHLVPSLLWSKLRPLALHKQLKSIWFKHVSDSNIM